MANPYRDQLDQKILCAEPLELVVLLYTGLQGSIREARRHLAAQDAAGRAQSVSKAMTIVGELATSLDPACGGELAVGLNRLYSFVAASLLDGNYRQVDAPFADAEAVTNTLLEAWSALSPSATAVSAPLPHPATLVSAPERDYLAYR